jgi:hypothetical protein
MFRGDNKRLEWYRFQIHLILLRPLNETPVIQQVAEYKRRWIVEITNCSLTLSKVWTIRINLFRIRRSLRLSFSLVRKFIRYHDGWLLNYSGRNVECLRLVQSLGRDFAKRRLFKARRTSAIIHLPLDKLIVLCSHRERKSKTPFGSG